MITEIPSFHSANFPEFPLYASVIIAFAAVIIVLIVIGLYGYR